ncbi:MAG: hypothetical protein COU41_00595 [Candidatus Nealsonbacteria bacterium CG10_big_fil_rev_8_21_14_0_10_36_228]|uniref:Glycosyltransferase family 1 protein n=3 Tax=Candidatus Nealsoniibacteriota TaxID=1817911 RepID=A0A2M8DLZ2_9BACT|nr:MAG: hypothetical protein COU41_00595 [Candidatus Nealsonbacteria bacterium CG10_big_fil_rev_8_21_14_0_10_36_228]PIX88342.1 MAG: hypothetical protein COZ30_01055 [Candidatus Nealsonbacteria bacterium CG_4_10_14_3_um_filter_36_16]PJB98877.1 MAG: hypothetical protein CO078_00575 [Candidatus Nealsonbacteria bacterium CG_4_9_14_0_8_um_filter_36_17]
MKKKIFFLHLTGGPLIEKDKIIFTEGGLVHALSASVNLKDDYEIKILCPNPPGQKGKREIDYRGVKIISLGGSRWLKLAQYGNLNFFKEVRKYIGELKPDFLIGNNLTASFLILFYPKKIKKIGIIHHLYSTLDGKIQPLIWIIRKLENFALILIKKLDAIGTVNYLVRDILIKRGYPKEKILIVGNGIDIQSFPFCEKKIKNSLIFIGRLAELKGVEDLTDVVWQVKKEIPKIILHLIGDGPKYSEIKKKIERLKLSDNVVMYGYLGDEEKIEVLKNCAIYISASKLEGFGIPLIEAMATGCVPVVSDIYAHRFIFQEKSVGYLIKDNKEMVEKIISLFKNENLRLSLAKEGRKLVEGNWTWEKVGERYKELLEIL